MPLAPGIGTHSPTMLPSWKASSLFLSGLRALSRLQFFAAAVRPRGGQPVAQVLDRVAPRQKLARGGFEPAQATDADGSRPALEQRPQQRHLRPCGERAEPGEPAGGPREEAEARGGLGAQQVGGAGEADVRAKPAAFDVVAKREQPLGQACEPLAARAGSLRQEVPRRAEVDLAARAEAGRVEQGRVVAAHAQPQKDHVGDRAQPAEHDQGDHQPAEYAPEHVPRLGPAGDGHATRPRRRAARTGAARAGHMASALRCEPDRLRLEPATRRGSAQRDAQPVDDAVAQHRRADLARAL